MKKLLPIIVFLGIIFFFFKPLIVNGLLPTPADNLIGLYHPFRDLYVKDYPRGIPYKNFLISDPIEQQYPWRFLSISLVKKMQFPSWNPYSFSGSPLFANEQSAVLYPLNILFLLFSFPVAWSLLILLQPLLGGVFIYVYLKKIKLSSIPSLLGAIIFAFSGFSVVWMQWNTIVQTIIWLPLILFIKEILLEKFSFKWAIGLLFAEMLSFFAGHLQTWFYVICISNTYLLFRVFDICRKNVQKESLLKAFSKKYFPFLLIGIVLLLIISIQLFPTFVFIFLSARNIDQIDWQQVGWFIPWQHAIGFIIPDFYGNPATLNYWGVWNYMEFAVYAGVIPFILSLYSLFFVKNKYSLFFWTILIIALLFAFPTPIAKIPYVLHIPFISTSQPTRLTFIIDFCLAILASIGLEEFLEGKKRVYVPVLITAFVFLGSWSFLLFHQKFSAIPVVNILIAKRNSVFPAGIFLVSSVVLLSQLFINGKNRKLFLTITSIILVVITMVDLLRYAQKFTPFTLPSYLYPQTKTINFLQTNLQSYRFMTTDRQLLPPNSSIVYKLQSVDGYDPLYLRRYAEFIAALERSSPNIDPPFGFNRIITPKNYKSPLINLLGVKYVLSITDLQNKYLKKVFVEGQTQVYENIAVLPRTFSVETIIPVKTKQEAIQDLFKNTDYSRTAIVENYATGQTTFSKSDVSIIHYAENKVILGVYGKSQSFIILTDVMYPTWSVFIDGIKSSMYQTDYLFRGVVVPSGKHTVVFLNSIL